MDHEELEKEFGSNSEVESKKENTDVDSSPLSPLLGPEDFQHPSFLNSIVSRDHSHYLLVFQRTHNTNTRASIPILFDVLS